MNIAESMNYRYENPGTNIEVDTKIAESFTKKDRKQNALDNFEAWASMSKDNKKINQILENYKKYVENKNLEDSINITR